jgi:hypothetical protein
MVVLLRGQAQSCTPALSTYGQPSPAHVSMLVMVMLLSGVPLDSHDRTSMLR